MLLELSQVTYVDIGKLDLRSHKQRIKTNHTYLNSSPSNVLAANNFVLHPL